MDSSSMSQFQTGVPGNTGFGASMPPVQPQGSSGPGGSSGSPLPMVQQVEVRPEEKKDISGLVKTIVIVILSLALVTFIGLFIWMYVEYNYEKEGVEYQISKVLAEEKGKWDTESTLKCAQDKKEPFASFSGPTDYGELSFRYPKTWSLYIEADASKGGDFRAYFNPGQVDPISNTSVNALRVSILTKPFDNVILDYQNRLKDKNKPLSMESVTVNGVTANLYTGSIPNTEFQGYILIFKIRDKTAIIQTDSVLFEEDYKTLIETIKFNA